MTTWTKEKIGGLGRVVTGKTPPTKNTEFFGEDYPFITPSDIPDYKIRHVTTVERFLSEKWRHKATNYLLPPNAVCYVCIGSTVGKSCLTDRDSFSNQQLNTLICKKDKANPLFVFYALKQKTPEIKRIADGSGAGKGIINKTSFENLTIELPNLDIQEKIASVLSAYDDLIENNEKRIKVLEEMAERLYREWFVYFRFPGNEKVRLVDSGTDLGKIPEGWEIAKLSDYVAYVRGCTYSSEEIDDESGSYYLVNLKHFNRGGGFRYDGKKFFSGTTNSNQLLHPGDIVVAVTDMTTDRAVIARPARIPTIKTSQITFSADVVKMISDKLPNTFLYQMLLTHRFTETTKQKANGANVLHLKPDAILEFQTVFPSRPLLELFDSTCSPIVNAIDRMSSVNDSLAQMRDLLIPQLVTGKRELKNT